MSSQRGNLTKKAQKHKNVKAFKNDMHDASQRTKMLNMMEVEGVCDRCKQIIDWKIKYKKYKPLSVPKKCTKCQRKKVKFAYHTACSSCAEKNNCCAKCSQDMDLSERLSHVSSPPEDVGSEVSQSVLDDENSVISSLNEVKICEESATIDPKISTLPAEPLAIDVNKEILSTESVTIDPGMIQLSSFEKS